MAATGNRASRERLGREVKRRRCQAARVAMSKGMVWAMVKAIIMAMATARARWVKGTKRALHPVPVGYPILLSSLLYFSLRLVASWNLLT